MYVPISPEAILILESLIKSWKPVARAALDPGTFEVNNEVVYLQLSGTIKVGEPAPRTTSVSYARLAGLALAKCNSATRTAIVREYLAGRSEDAVKAATVAALDLPRELRDGSARIISADFEQLLINVEAPEPVALQKLQEA